LLPNIDFNIISGNSLIGLICVDEKSFNLMGEESILLTLTGQKYQAILAKKIAVLNYKKNRIFSWEKCRKPPR
jgi:hypothetical protein